MGLPGFFAGDLLAELTEEDRFLSPMKRAIVRKKVTTFNKLAAYMALSSGPKQRWSITA